MGNEKYWSAVIPKKIKLESVQYGKETKIARGKPFSSPEPTILLVCAKDRDLWQGPGNAQAQ